MTRALIHYFGENRISVMDEKTIRVVCRDRFTELLDSPLSRGMRRDIDMNQPSAGMLNPHKYTKDTESRGDCHAKVKSQDARGVIAEKGGPALRLTACARATHAVVRHVFAHGSWGDLQAEFEQELVGDAFLTPGRIVQGHPSNEGL